MRDQPLKPKHVHRVIPGDIGARRTAQRLAFVLSLATLPWTSAVAQTPAEVSAFANFVNRNNVTMFVSGELTMRVTTGVEENPGCTLSISKGTVVNGTSTTRESVALDLAASSPAPRIEFSTNSLNASIFIESTDGTKRFTIRRQNTGAGRGLAVSTDWVEFAFPDSAVAVRAAELSAAAITACGGVQRSAETTAGAAAEREREDGTDPETLRIRGGCLRTVRALLFNAEEATFPDGVVVLRDESKGTLSITGDVIGTNRLGGRVKNTYLCSYSRNGDAWVLDGAPIVF